VRRSGGGLIFELGTCGLFRPNFSSSSGFRSSQIGNIYSSAILRSLTDEYAICFRARNEISRSNVSRIPKRHPCYMYVKLLSNNSLIVSILRIKLKRERRGV